MKEHLHRLQEIDGRGCSLFSSTPVHLLSIVNLAHRAIAQFFCKTSKIIRPAVLIHFSALNFSCLGSTNGTVLTVKTERREVPGSNPGCACRPSRSEFSVFFSETRVNMG